MPEEVYSVSEITADIRESLEDRFHEVWVEGEINNYRLPGSGHHYFTLKDASAQLACVLFKGAASRNPVRLGDGVQVQVFGNVSVYEARGQYQLIAQLVQPKGFGDLQAKFEALKRKLDSEGLFDPAKKVSLPVFPQTIGVVTSPTGAAIRDMLNVLERRAPWVRVIIHPARVQGEGAAEEIAAGVAAFDQMEAANRPDLVIVARGGGSIEDLWAFNEEEVARAIAACSIPVMSGVGHEIDFTIADFVADRREPTPSAAAENATPDGATVRRHLEILATALQTRASDSINRRMRTAESLRRELEAREPERRIQNWSQSLDYLGERLHGIVDTKLQRAQSEFQMVSRMYSAVQPEREIRVRREEIASFRDSLSKQVDRSLADRAHALHAMKELLRSLSPEAVLQRGYSMTLDEKGKLITSTDQVKSGDKLRTRLSDGEVSSVAE